MRILPTPVRSISGFDTWDTPGSVLRVVQVLAAFRPLVVGTVRIRSMIPKDSLRSMFGSTYQVSGKN